MTYHSPNPANFVPAFFCIDDEGARYAGFHDPKAEWNGWRIPFFTREVGEQIARDFAAVRFDAAQDLFLEFCDADPKASPAESCGNEVPGFGRLYQIGDGWIWDLAEEPQRFVAVADPGAGLDAEAAAKARAAAEGYSIAERLGDTVVAWAEAMDAVDETVNFEPEEAQSLLDLEANSHVGRQCLALMHGLDALLLDCEPDYEAKMRKWAMRQCYCWLYG